MNPMRRRGPTLGFEAHGAGRPLILLHSLLADRSVFDAVVPELAAKRRVVLVDLPGFGESSPAEPSVEAIADRVAGIFPALGLGADTDVLGNGFGAFVASALAIRHGTAFDRLVLAGVGVAFSEQGRAAVNAMAERARSLGMEAVAEAAMKRLFPEAFIASHPEIVERRKAALSRVDRARFVELCGALASVDLREGMGRVRNPTLVVVGSLDPATTPAMAREAAAAIPGGSLTVLDGCGHAPMAQDPRAFVGAIAPFLGL